MRKMRSMFLALLFVMVMTLPAMAQVTIDGPSTSGALSPIGGANAQAGATASVIDTNVNMNTNVNTNTNLNTNTQFGFVAPNQETTVRFRSPTQFMNTPFHAVPELNFGQGRMKDVTRELPNFSLFGIKPLGAEPIREIIDVTANVKFKRLYKNVLSIAKDIVDDGNDTREVRYQVIRAEAQKSWATGGNLGGGSSALSSTGLIGGAGSAGIVPQWGGTKADDLFTIIFVKVSL